MLISMYFYWFCDVRHLPVKYDFDWFSQSYDTCLNYTLNDIVLQMTQAYIFIFVVQFSSESAELYSELLNYLCS